MGTQDLYFFPAALGDSAIQPAWRLARYFTQFSYHHMDKLGSGWLRSYPRTVELELEALVCRRQCLCLVLCARLSPAVDTVEQLVFLPAGPRPVAVFPSVLQLGGGGEMVVMATPGHGDPHFIRVPVVHEAVGLSGQNGIFLTVPSENT